MRALWMLSLANYRSFVRDRAALFWSLAFPVIFVILFGTIFSSGQAPDYKIGWVDLDGSPAAEQLRTAVAATTILVPTDEADQATAEAAMRAGDIDALVVVPAGTGAAIAAAQSGTSVDRVDLVVFTDPSRQSTSAAIAQTLGGVTGALNLQLAGRTAVLGVEPKTIQVETLNGASYFVPSILAMALMQLGVFAAIPLVALREKLVLKRLSATPLTRRTLVGGNVSVRLLIALAQTIIIVGLGVVLFDVSVVGGPLTVAFLVALGAVTFIALGYVIAAFTRTEEQANGVTQIVSVPMMFLSGIFFPLEFLPDWLRAIAYLMPLTYLGDALRQVMVNGVPLVPLGVDVLVLAGWLIACMLISGRFFRWQ